MAPLSISLTVGATSGNGFIPGVSEVRYIPVEDLNATDKNVGNLPGVTRTNATVSAFGITQTTASLYENLNFVNTIVDVRGTGVITFRNCRFTMTNGYTSADTVAALIRVLNGTNVTEVIFEDCEFHNRCQRGLNGISGRCVTIRRSVFTGFVDSIRCVAPPTGSMTAATFGFHTYDCWFGDFAWFRTPSQHDDIHSSDLQVHADGDQIGTTLGTIHENPTFAMYVSEWVGTGTPGCSAVDGGNPYVVAYTNVSQATMNGWRSTYCSTATYAPESPDGIAHLLPNGSEGVSVAAVMVNRAPVTVLGGHMYGSFIPVNIYDTNIPNPATTVIFNRVTFHNDMRNGPTNGAGRGTTKGYAFLGRTGRSYPGIPTSGDDRNVWADDGSTVTITYIA